MFGEGELVLRGAPPLSAGYALLVSTTSPLPLAKEGGQGDGFWGKGVRQSGFFDIFPQRNL